MPPFPFPYIVKLKFMEADTHRQTNDPHNNISPANSNVNTLSTKNSVHLSLAHFLLVPEYDQIPKSEFVVPVTSMVTVCRPTTM